MTEFEERLRATLSNAYDIERELGGGGMSRVFVATDRSLGRKVVIKLLAPELTADVNRGRFRREIQVAAQLQHPHIVPLLSAGEHEDLLYFTMPFISGESLKSSVDKNGPFSIAEAVRVMYHVSEALDHAHGEGVVHRDIKPANILRSSTFFLVTDFGVAKALNAAMPSSAMTSTGMAIGTPAYMAPEQLAGDPAADHRIDIYALGLLVYELLNGKSPFAATTPQRILAAVLTQDPAPLIEMRPDVPRSLSEIVMSCLSKEPEDRPASARDVLDALDTFSTASGEIWTMEHGIPRIKATVPIPVSSTPARAQPATAGERTPGDQVEAVPTDRPHGNRKKMLAGGLALLIPVAAAAIFVYQGGGDDGVAPPTNATAPVAEPSTVQPRPAAVTPALATESPAAAPYVTSKEIADSLRRTARAEAAKRTAATRDSLKRVRDTDRGRARSAAVALLADANARKSFTDGATRMGGVLGKQRRGDLQTQINALQPFLTTAGLSYEQFKGIVQESGIKLFDEFGRIVPDSLRQFSGLSR